MQGSPSWPAGRPTGQDSLLVGRISPGRKVMHFAVSSNWQDTSMTVHWCDDSIS